jgi:predicted MFS family arabinose efflux permease
MAVETVPPSDRADVQAAMTGSRAVGGMAASALVGLLVARLGYGALMPAMAIIALLPLPFLIRLRPRGEAARHPRPPLAAFARFFDRPRLVFAFYALVMSLGLSGTMGLVTLFMHSSLGAGSGAIGGYGVLVSGGTLAGALIYAALRRWLGVELMTAMGQLMLALVAVTLSLQQSVEAVTLLGLLVGTTYGYVLTGVLEMTMARSDLAIAATSFALLMSIFNVGGSIGDGLATAAVGAYGFQPTFLAVGAVSLVSLLPLMLAHAAQRSAPAAAGPVTQAEGATA